MKKLTVLISFIPLLSFGQSRLEWLVNEIPSDDFRRGLSFHSSIRPHIALSPYHPSFVSMDTLETQIPQQPKRMDIFPVADFGFRAEKTFQYRAMAGVGMSTNLNEKWFARMTYLHGIEQASDFFHGKHSFSLPIDSNLSQKIDLRGRVSYSPNKFFNFQAGWDNQFIGEGSRSMFLGDYGKPQGFGLARMNFWRVEYLTMYQFLQEKTTNNERKSKFASSHYLSYNVTRWLQFGLFESVVFQPKDTLLNRGFEPEYLNPMVFFRPQEYALGSSDNVLIGVDAKIKIRNVTFYGQLMMDEFNLADIKGRTRWWANKYAIQMGVKTNFQKNHSLFFLRGEMNIVRPYTYSHLSNSQSYTNLGDPLAHPYGANFAEILGEVYWQRKKWKGQFFASYSLKGYDRDSANWGGNIHIPYINRPVELKDFGHKIGQGQGNNTFRTMVRISYRLSPKIKLEAFIEGHFRYNTFLSEPKAQVVVGIRSQLWNDYRNY
jgi:hypothetical protein